MKIRSSHVVVVILLIVGAVILVATLRTSRAASKDKGDIITEARRLVQTGQGSAVSSGDVKPNAQGGTDVPVIETETKEFHMGTIVNDKKTTKQMMVYNKGTSDLVINQVKTSCGCTQGTFHADGPDPRKPEDQVIPPGGKAPLYITVDPFRIPGFYAQKTLTIYSNDIANPMVNVDVVTLVDPEYSLEPNTLDFGTLDIGTSAVQHVRARQNSATPVKVTGVETIANGSRIATQLRKANATEEPQKCTVVLHDVPKDQWKSPDRPEWDIEVTLGPTIPMGSYKDHFYILSDAKRVPKATYAIQAEIKSFFKVEPGILRVRDGVKPGQQNIAEDTIIGEKAFEITDLAITGSDLVVTTKPGQEPNVTLLELGAKPNARPGLKTETITMKVKSGDKSVDYSTRAFVSVISN